MVDTGRYIFMCVSGRCITLAQPEGPERLGLGTIKPLTGLTRCFRINRNLVNLENPVILSLIWSFR